MQNQIENEELTINFKKIFRILDYRKKLILKVFASCVLLLIALSIVTPKKYATDANLYINRANDTNLAELNPYVISYMANLGGGLTGMLAGGGSGLQNEIEIMKSPLVMDNVIRENNLKYQKGTKKGEFISTAAFLKKNISIENIKGTNIINIAYRSKDPVLSYNIVNSIINNYEQANKNLNKRKAEKDKAMLEASYADTNKDVNKKLSAMKNSSSLPATAIAGLGPMLALRGHNKAIGGSIGSLQTQIVEGQKDQISLEQDVEKLKLVKSKLEWTNLVEKMADDTSNVIVLKNPEIRSKFEQSSPRPLTNLILGLIIGLFASVFAVIIAEKTDKTLSYSDLNDNIIYDIEKDIDELKIILMSNPNDTVLIVDFDGFENELLKNLKDSGNFKIVHAEINSKVVNEISKTDKLIFAAKIGETSKKLYHQIKNICKETNKKIYTEIV